MVALTSGSNDSSSTNDLAMISHPFSNLKSLLEKKQTYLGSRYAKLTKLKEAYLNGEQLNSDQLTKMNCLSEVQTQVEFVTHVYSVLKGEEQQYKKQRDAFTKNAKKEANEFAKEYACFVSTLRDTLRIYGLSRSEYRSSLNDAGVTDEDIAKLDIVADSFNTVCDGDFENYPKDLSRLSQAFWSIFTGDKTEIAPGITGAVIRPLISKLQTVKPKSPSPLKSVETSVVEVPVAEPEPEPEIEKVISATVSSVEVEEKQEDKSVETAVVVAESTAESRVHDNGTIAGPNTVPVPEAEVQDSTPKDEAVRQKHSRNGHQKHRRSNTAKLARPDEANAEVVNGNAGETGAKSPAKRPLSAKKSANRPHLNGKDHPKVEKSDQNGTLTATENQKETSPIEEGERVVHQTRPNGNKPKGERRPYRPMNGSTGNEKSQDQRPFKKFNNGYGKPRKMDGNNYARSESSRVSVPEGYFTDSTGYLRPLPGRCGFTLALK